MYHICTSNKLWPGTAKYKLNYWYVYFIHGIKNSSIHGTVYVVIFIVTTVGHKDKFTSQGFKFENKIKKILEWWNHVIVT